MSAKAQSIRVVQAPLRARWLQAIGLLLAVAVVAAIALAFRPHTSPASGSQSGNTSTTMVQVGGDSSFQYKLLP